MKKAIGYIRVSTEGQAGPDAYGKEVQREYILKYAQKNNYDIVEWKEDHVSGAKSDRPAWNDILYGEVSNPPVEAVIAFKNDRISREILDYFYFTFILEKKGIKLISTQEDFGAMGDFAPCYLAITQYIAEKERQTILMRTTGGRAAKAKSGGYAGGKAPYGYRSENKQLVVDENEAAVVRRIFDLRAQGCTMRDIERKLASDGVTSRSGGRISTPTIQSILNNRHTYEGYYKYGPDGEWVKGQHEAILPDALLS